MPRQSKLLNQYHAWLEKPEKITPKQWYDLRAKMRGTIESLVLFAEKLPQHQYKQLFTDESLEPLIKAIMLRKVEPGFQDRSNIAKDPIKFRIGCMLLTWALGIDSVLKNPYAQKLWMEKMLPMRSLVDALYDDMKRERV